MAGYKTYTLRNGVVVTSKDGEWPLQYANRTAAEKAAAKIPGARVYHPLTFRAFYVKVSKAHTTPLLPGEPAL